MIALNCTWLEEQADGRYVLGSMRDHTAYSSGSCFGTVDLHLIEGHTNIYEFADKNCRDNLIAALPAAVEPFEVEREAPVQRELQVDVDEGRRLAEAERAAATQEAETPLLMQVARAPGERQA